MSIADTPAPVGIGGWLYLVALGLCLTPIRLLVEIAQSLRYFGPTWRAVTTPGTRVYHPLFGALVLGELVANVALLVWVSVILYLFFCKKRAFPPMMIAFIIARGAIQVALLGLALAIPVAATTVDLPAFISVGIGIVFVLVWVPYFLRSRRVAATFVR